MPTPDSRVPLTSVPAPRAHLSRVPSAGAIRLDIAANDPALPTVIGGLITAEPHGEDWTLLIEGAHGTKLLHLSDAMPLGEAMQLVRTALASVSISDTSYPERAPSESEVASRVSRGYGS